MEVILTIKDIEPILRKWAKSSNFVIRLWIYGSRITGNASEDSDIDIAIEVLSLRGSEDAYTRFFFDHKKWAANLQKYLPWKVHLCHYDSTVSKDLSVEDGNVKKEVDRYGLLVYERMKENTNEHT